MESVMVALPMRLLILLCSIESHDPGQASDRSADRSSVRNERHRLLVNSELATVPGLFELIAHHTWVVPHGTEPGTYVGTAPSGPTQQVLIASGRFEHGRPTKSHRERVGEDAIEYRLNTDLLRWHSLHVVLSPSTGKFEAHVDRFNPYGSPLEALLHWLVDVLPKR